MKLSCLPLVIAAASLLVSVASAENFAATVVSYDPGVGYVAGFTNASAVLGSPSQLNPFGEATDPFNPPYGQAQVLSIGQGGALTVKLSKVVHNRRRPVAQGLDFIVFGNSGFIITNDWDVEASTWVGTPATDGSLFAASTGETRVSVSRDGRHFYTLNPRFAPLVDGSSPSDAAGDPRIPVDPTLDAVDFAGQTLDGIRDLYDGSAGGTGYNIAWAQTRRGRHIFLSWIRYVRIEVITGKAEIDALSATERVRPSPHNN